MKSRGAAALEAFEYIAKDYVGMLNECDLTENESLKVEHCLQVVKSALQPFAPVKLIEGLDDAIADFSWVKSDTVRDDILIEAREVRAFLEAARAYLDLQGTNPPAPQVDVEVERTFARLGDIKHDLSFIEAAIKQKAVRNSDKEDAGKEPKFMRFSMNEWYAAANCLQFLYCNYDTILDVLKAAIVEDGAK
jgi:hypothetical protein